MRLVVRFSLAPTDGGSGNWASHLGDVIASGGEHGAGIPIRDADAMTMNRFVAPAATILVVAGCNLTAAAQVKPAPTSKITPPVKVIPLPQKPVVVQTPVAKPVLPVQPINRPGLNITKWGIVERQGSQTHGKTGETLFVEGRDLDPNQLIVETRLGSRAIRLVRKPGGNSGRVEFRIPPEAITGDITVTLQAVGNGNTVLSTDFGVCDRPKITGVTSPITYRPEDFLSNTEILIPGKILTLSGECLDEMTLLAGRSGLAGNISVGQSGSLLIKRFVSKDYAKVELELHGLTHYSQGAFPRIEGPMRLTVPATGPNLVIDDVRNVSQVGGQPAPPPAALVPITIQSVTSNSRWGSRELPFVVVSSVVSGSTPSLQNPFHADRQIRLSGQNLLANAGTNWFIGAVPLTPPNVNSMISLPSNAVSGQVCAVRRDGVRSCASTPTVVVATPRISTAPTGWPVLGTVDSSTRVQAPIRRAMTITGFDLKPPPGLGMEAVVEVGNFDRAGAARCDLDLQVHRFDSGTLTFSFGTPGGTRPAACTEQEEANLGFLRTPGAVAELKLKWVYQGDSSATQAVRWNLIGVR